MAGCSSANQTNSVVILTFGSDFMLRNFLAAKKDILGYHTTTDVGGQYWLLATGKEHGQALEPLDQFGFEVLPPPMR